MPGPQIKGWKKYEALRLEGYSKESAAKIANARRPQEEEQAITENQQPEPEQLPTVRLQIKDAPESRGAGTVIVRLSGRALVAWAPAGRRLLVSDPQGVAVGVLTPSDFDVPQLGDALVVGIERLAVLLERDAVGGQLVNGCLDVID